MAAYTSTQAGNWSNSATWGGGGVPGDGDTATVAHAVAVDTNTTVGTSPNDTTTYVVTVTTNGVLTINTGVELRCKGNMSISATTATERLGLAINGSGTLMFDGSAIGTSRNYQLYFQVRNYMELNGTDDANRATIDSDAGGNYWRLIQQTDTTTAMQSDWGMFKRCGNGTVYGFDRDVRANSGTSLSITNTVFENCGPLRFAASHATATVLFEDVEFRNSPGTLQNIFRGFAGSSCTMNRCIFDRWCQFFVSETWTTTNTYFGKNVSNVSPSTGWASGSGNNYIGHVTGNGLSWNGTLKDHYYLHNAGDNINYFNIQFNVVTASDEISGIIFDYADTSPTDPDGFGINSLPVSTAVLVKNNIKLPDSAGVSSGAFCNHYAATAMEGFVSLEHNTYITIGTGQTGVYVGESNRGQTGMIESFKSNLAWTPTGETGGFKLFRSSHSTVQDFVTTANADYNWGWNLGVGTEGNGYSVGDTATDLFSTGTPDTNGGNGDPQFVDTSRNLVRFDIDYLGNSAATAWADATSYAVGDVVSASDAGYYDGETINWRCITAHTSATGNATNGKPGAVSGFRTNWEPMSLYRLREDPTRIASLITWVRAGYAVQNASLQNAGHDSVTIGAGEFVSSGSAIPVLAHHYSMQG